MKTIKQLTIVGLTCVGISIPIFSMASASENVTVTGDVEKVWEDGFRLDTGERTFRVDSWDVYGDNTAQNVEVGDRLAVTGEFDLGEFDASFIHDLAENN